MCYYGTLKRRYDGDVSDRDRQSSPLCVYAFLRAGVYVDVHMCACEWMRVCVWVRTHARVCVCVRVCESVCMCMCVYVCVCV